MRQFIRAALAACILAATPFGATAQVGARGFHEVLGVEADDMLKMRAGPGTGYQVLIGLPNGAVVRVFNCQPSGGTSWCKVGLKVAPGLKGYVSAAYLRKL